MFLIDWNDFSLSVPSWSYKDVPTTRCHKSLNAEGNWCDMAKPSLHMVYQVVTVAKLTYAASASAWCSFTSASATDHSRLET